MTGARAATSAMTGGDRSRRAARGKYVSLLAILVASILVLLAANLTWLTLRLRVEGGNSTLEVTGQLLAPVLSALALAGFALAGALSIASPLVRIALGVLQVLLGVGIVLGSVPSIVDPLSAGARQVSAATGTAGATDRLVESYSATPWPAVAIAAGLIGIVAGLAVVFRGHRWPGPKRSYDAPEDRPSGSGTEQPEPAAAAPANAWDSLSRGDDPTASR